MKYGSLSKSKYASNNVTTLNKAFKKTDLNLKLKNSNTNTLVVDKDISKPSGNSFRPGVLGVTGNKFKTTKNSRKFNVKLYLPYYLAERSSNNNRNFSGERKHEGSGSKLMIQNYLKINNNLNVKSNGLVPSNNTNNINTNINNANNQNSKLKEIMEEGNGIENLLKKKIMKKKEKTNSNILNFSNPYNNKFGNAAYYKLQLENSAHNHNPSYLHNLKKELEIGRYDDKSGSNQHTLYANNNHKRSSSTYEDDDDLHSNRQDPKKSLMSPRMESIINKYYEIFDKKKESTIQNNKQGVSTSVEWKKKSENNNTIKNSTLINSNPNKTNTHKFSISNEFLLNQKNGVQLGSINLKYSNIGQNLNTHNNTNTNNLNSSNNFKKLNSNTSNTSSISHTKQSSGNGNNFTSTQKSMNFQNGINIAELHLTSTPNTNKNDLNNQSHRGHSGINSNSNSSNNHNKQIISKTTHGTKNNSRKNSIERTILKNSKNLFLAANPTQKTLKASTNNSTNNSSSTLMSNHHGQNNKYSNLNNINFDMEKENNNNLLFNNIITDHSQPKKTITNTINTKSSFHTKVLSEIPVLSSVNMNLLNNNQKNNVASSILTKNFLYNNNLKYYNMKNTHTNINSSINTSSNNNNQNKRKEDETLDKSIKKKMGPVTMPVTTLQSKSNSKNNSKSVSRIEEFLEGNPYSNMHIQSKQVNNNLVQKSVKTTTGNSLTKKYIPVTTSHSPTHLLTKDLVSNFNKKDKRDSYVNKHVNNEGKVTNFIKMSTTPISPNVNEKVSNNNNNNIKEKMSIKNINIENIKKEKIAGYSKQNSNINNNLNNHINNNKEEIDFKKDSLEGLLDNSNDSIKSTMRESNYYRREAEKITGYIRQHYLNHKEYPKTNSKFYKYGRLLGRGAFGKVNLALHVGTGRLVAIKSFNKSKLTSENARRKIIHETNILKNLKHPSIVKIYETFETAKYILIVMEYVSCGDLLSFVRKRSKLNETIAKFIFKQIIEALQYIHSQNIVHRDIKLDNILIDLQNNIKICDFGVSKQVKRSDTMHDQCGTPAYIAPEILRNQGYEGFNVDVWSAGVVLYAMLSGTVPFKANNMNDLHKLIIKGNYQMIKDISDEACNLITSLLEIDPKKRITIEQILNHPWLKNTDKNKSKLNLFTGAEKILLSKSNLDYRFANKDDLIENFTEKNLDTLQESENQNIGTKSIILAPFNSSIKQNDSFLHKDLEIENEVLKYCGKAKELNRLYELNNNGEIDNGIIISPQDNNSVNDITPIYSPYAPSPFHNSFNNNIQKRISQPISPAQMEENGNGNRNKILNSPKEREESIGKNLVKNGNNLHSLNNQFAINEKLIKEVEDLGYKKDYVIKCILANEINYATATYYLLFNNGFDY